jgi:hypothetical protein
MPASQPGEKGPVNDGFEPEDPGAWKTSSARRCPKKRPLIGTIVSLCAAYRHPLSVCHRDSLQASRKRLTDDRLLPGRARADEVADHHESGSDPNPNVTEYDRIRSAFRPGTSR